MKTSHRTIAGQGTLRAYLRTDAAPPAIERANNIWSPVAATYSPALAAAATGGCAVAEVISIGPPARVGALHGRR